MDLEVLEPKTLDPNPHPLLFVHLRDQPPQPLLPSAAGREEEKPFFFFLFISLSNIERCEGRSSSTLVTVPPSTGTAAAVLPDSGNPPPIALGAVVHQGVAAAKVEIRRAFADVGSYPAAAVAPRHTATERRRRS